MSRLPTLKPKEVLATLQRAGFDVVRVRGSHYQLLNPITKSRVTVPHHINEGNFVFDLEPSWPIDR